MSKDFRGAKHICFATIISNGLEKHSRKTEGLRHKSGGLTIVYWCPNVSESSDIRPYTYVAICAFSESAEDTYFVKRGWSIIEEPRCNHQHQRETSDQPQTMTCHPKVVDIVDLESAHRWSHLRSSTKRDVVVDNWLKDQLLPTIKKYQTSIGNLICTGVRLYFLLSAVAITRRLHISPMSFFGLTRRNHGIDYGPVPVHTWSFSEPGSAPSATDHFVWLSHVHGTVFLPASQH